MLSGLSFLQMQLDQKVKNNMSWMVVHSFIGSLGLEDSQNIGRYVTGMYCAAVVIFDGYKQSSTKFNDVTHQRGTGGKTVTSVTFSDYETDHDERPLLV